MKSNVPKSVESAVLEKLKAHTSADDISKEFGIQPAAIISFAAKCLAEGKLGSAQVPEPPTKAPEFDIADAFKKMHDNNKKEEPVAFGAISIDPNDPSSIQKAIGELIGHIAQATERTKCDDKDCLLCRPPVSLRPSEQAKITFGIHNNHREYVFGAVVYHRSMGFFERLKMWLSMYSSMMHK